MRYYLGHIIYFVHRPYLESNFKFENKKIIFATSKLKANHCNCNQQFKMQLYGVAGFCAAQVHNWLK